MSSALLQHLASLSWVTTLATLFVALLRAPLRGTLGARAAYWLWLALPASALSLALPHLAPLAGNVTTPAPDAFGWVWARVAALLAAIQVSRPVGTAACIVWLLGAGTALVWMVLRQRSFARSLGALVALPDGTWRSRAVVEPMLLGALRPRVLVPLDFEQRYSSEEREFVLAHEQAHMRRGDTLVNAFGTAWLCVFWFNPVMFWAMRLLRFDQDLAVDAAVLAAAGKAQRGRYAEALLKAQLAGEAAFPLPVACHWRSVHPLRRRIAELRRPIAGRTRHGIGILCVATLVASVSLTARAVQPASHIAQPIAPLTAVGVRPAAASHGSGKVCPIAARRAAAAAAAARRLQPRARARLRALNGVRTP
ncbi:MAG: energy transducer TonB [Gammaproteobacteria bacterium]|nr:energy transducer TonB [Gammaproteobacteria bacterium]